MKRTIAALALLAAAAPALANTGTIQFRGAIKGATCPIEIIDPVSGSPTTQINLGNYSQDTFKAVGDRTPPRPFSLRIADGTACGFATGDDATVTYQGVDGTTGDYYAIKTGASAAADVAIAIRDRTVADVKPGHASAAYPVNDTGATLLDFTAAIVSTATTVEAGAVESDIAFIVNIP